ncbi:hypothetical protein [Brachyspira murdochii]|uniref:Uncharacterized protein n=2 Tax=Brachyspira murdochii TaxID=84378 RepID=A0ABX5B7W5_9SPIR|nr:hypothetical protein [Brachyspira murdochii]PPS22728.1 hypothetical protein DJ52_03210 [Brachyspira murdochii]
MKQNYLTKKEIESIKKKAEKYADLFDEITYVLSEEKMNYIIDLDECINKLKDDNELDLSIKAHLLTLKKENILKTISVVKNDIINNMNNNYTIYDYSKQYNNLYNSLWDLEYQIKNIDIEIYKLKNNEK